MIDGTKTKAVVTVAEMARMCGLSRARFYQLMGTIFPEPSRDETTGRPFYTEEQQQVCLEVRRRNCGVNGRPVLFYAKGNRPAAKAPKRRTTKPKKSNEHTELIDAVRSLGLTTVTVDQVAVAIKDLFPSGTQDVPSAEVIRAVFIHLKRKDSSDNVGR